MIVDVELAQDHRVEKRLEDACIKLSVVASDIFGVSGRVIITALIAGERDPEILADMARARMRPKIGLLREAFAGWRAGTFDEHHRFLLARMMAGGRRRRRRHRRRGRADRGASGPFR